MTKYQKTKKMMQKTGLSKACDAVCKAVAEAINRIDWQKVTESAKKALEGVSNGRTENRIDQREVQGMSETDT